MMAWEAEIVVVVIMVALGREEEGEELSQVE
jgi:hypothetical protein